MIRLAHNSQRLNIEEFLPLMTVGEVNVNPQHPETCTRLGSVTVGFVGRFARSGLGLV